MLVGLGTIVVGLALAGLWAIGLTYRDVAAGRYDP
jgi:hypothetical protein